MLNQPRWTHIALPSGDLDASIAWYEEFTPLVLLDRREDADGQSAWLSHAGQVDNPFVLVLVMFFREKGAPHPTMAPFAHIGIEMPERADVDRIAGAGPSRRVPVMGAHGAPAAGGLHLCADRPRRQRDRDLAQPGRVRQGAGGVGRRALLSEHHGHTDRAKSDPRSLTATNNSRHESSVRLARRRETAVDHLDRRTFLMRSSMAAAAAGVAAAVPFGALGAHAPPAPASPTSPSTCPTPSSPMSATPPPARSACTSVTGR